jgi:hypothetical protein
MQKRLFCAASLAAALFLSGCNPTYNWRDYSSADASYRVMFPAKPVSHTRAIDLNGMQVEMTMTAAEVEGAMFAVGTGVAPDAAQAQAAVGAMRTALLRNIGAKVERESTAAAGTHTAVDIDAIGSANGQPVKLRGHFEARGERFYQVIVMGKTSAMSAERTDQFISSFALL